MAQENPSVITFLGTAGARFMVSKQLAASGGMWMDLAGTQILVDPGPGCIVQVTKRKLDPEKLSGIIVTHRHLDHANDVNVMVEAMTAGGFKKRGWLFCPTDALNSEPVLFSYQRKFLDGIELLEAGKSYTAGEVRFSTPVRHDHTAETYGIRFDAAGHTFSYITDTRYFDGLIPAYAGSELLIMNIVLVHQRDTVAHLAVPDAENLIRQLKPKVAILTHYGMGVWQAHPWEIAEKMSAATGVTVKAGRDGMKFDLAELGQA